MLDIFNEINDYQTDLIKSIAIFYLVITSNFLGDILFTCYQKEYLIKHRWLQYLILFLLFYFTVTVVSNTGTLEFTPPIEKLLYSFLSFIGILIVMRLDIRVMGFVILLIFLMYFLEINKDFYLNKANTINNSSDKSIYESNRFWITLNYPFELKMFPIKDDQFILINKIENILYYVIIIVLVLGVISYGGELRESLKNKNITWFTVLTDTKVCNIKDRKSFWEYLKMGLGLKL
jgi:hypothetical protein